MAVEFRLLGDVAVRVDGRGVDIGHARQRCVLAALLADVNRIVPADQLLDRVWADRRPRHARNALSGYVSRLRRLLPATEVRLGRENGGYRLTADPLAVDLHHFRHLVTLAHDGSTEDGAIALLDWALELWRGTPFATVDTPWVNGLRDALDAERLAAELDRDDLALRLGREPALAELSTRAAAHPLNERVAGQLMLALYRGGRQADALRHYERIRRTLAEELGADPSPPLRDLHRAILAADPTLATAPTVPRQLPAPLGPFAGRVRALDHLDNTGNHVVAVSGTAGVGKTALALHWAHRAAGRFRDGQLYVDLRGYDPGGSVTSPAEAVRAFLDALDVPPQRIPAGLTAQLGLYRSLLAGRRMLVLLDNARDADQVRPLLPGAPGCLVLVTSRGQLTSLVAREGADPLPLDLLSDAEAGELLAVRAGADRVAAEPGAVAEVITRCARLPLALSVVAARAATHPDLTFAALAEDLRADVRGGLDALAGADPLTDPCSVFSWSYRTLSPPAARLFRLLGVHFGPDIGLPAAASIAGLPVAEVRPLLTELTAAHLTVERGTRRHVMHDLLRAYAAELSDDDERQQATHRMLDHYLHAADAADRLLLPGRDPLGLAPARPGVTPETPDDAMAWFAAEHSVLVAAVEYAAAHGFPTHAWQLARTLTTYFDRRAYWPDWAVTQRAAVAATRMLADQQAEAEAHRSLAYACAELGDHDAAHRELQHALDLFTTLGDDRGRARTHLALSWTFDRRSCPAEALSHGRHALDLYRAVGARTGQARALNIIGWSHAQLHDRDALATCEQAIALHRELGDSYGEAASWDSLGYAHHHLGHYAQAVGCYDRAADLHRTAGDRQDEAQVLTHLGDVHEAAGRPELAGRAWRTALVILTELDHPDADRVRATIQAAGLE